LQNTFKKTIRNGNKVTECAGSAVPILAGYHEASENAGGSEIPWGGSVRPPLQPCDCDGGYLKVHTILIFYWETTKKIQVSYSTSLYSKSNCNIDGSFNSHSGRFCGFVLEPDLKPGKGTSSRIY
jgi:hypothetical protein